MKCSVQGLACANAQEMILFPNTSWTSSKADHLVSHLNLDPDGTKTHTPRGPSSTCAPTRGLCSRVLWSSLGLECPSLLCLSCSASRASSDVTSSGLLRKSRPGRSCAPRSVMAQHPGALLWGIITPIVISSPIPADTHAHFLQRSTCCVALRLQCTPTVW